MNAFFNEIKTKYQQGNLLIKLIAINVAVYLLMVVLNILSPLITGQEVGYLMDNYIYPNLAFSSNLSTFLFKPWTLITHQFVHQISPGHLLGNMLILYFLGKLFINYFSQKQLLGLYLLGGTVGALALLLIYNLSPFFPHETIAYGASAAVMAIAIAACSYTPNQFIYVFGVLKLKMQWLGLMLIAFDLFSFYDGNTGGHIAHLVGAGSGFFFTQQYKKGIDITKNINQFISFLNNLFTVRKTRSKMKVTYSNSTRTMSDAEYNKKRRVSQTTIDEILDKISRNGYDSLSKVEKETLFKYSNK